MNRCNLSIGTLLLLMAVGCGKNPVDKVPDDNTNPPKADPPRIIPREGDLSGGGAFQGSRNAAGRLANLVDLDQMYKSLAVSMEIDNRIPGKDEILKNTQKENPKLAGLINDGTIVLTGCTKMGEDATIIAYTAYPQGKGEHYIVTQKGTARLGTEQLKKDLKNQGTPYVEPELHK